MNDLTQKEVRAIYKSFSTGTTPKASLRHLRTGCDEYVEYFDLMMEDTIKYGSSDCKFLIADFGRGKSFLIEVLQDMAKKNNFVVAKIDLSATTLLYHEEKGVNTYRSIASNMNCRGCAGSSMEFILDKIVELVIKDFQGNLSSNNPQLLTKVNEVLEGIGNSKNRDTFNRVILTYVLAYLDEDELNMMRCVRWLRGEYENRALVRKELNIDIIINNSNYKDFLILLTDLVRLVGYNGLVIFIDECVNIYKAHFSTREKNYETILNIYNDVTQEEIENIIFFFAGDEEFLSNNTKGMYSYGALKSRLMLEDEDYVDANQPVWMLRYLNISQQEELITKIISIYELYHSTNYNISIEEIKDYVECQNIDLNYEMIETRTIISKFNQSMNKFINGDLSSEEFFGMKKKINSEKKDSGDFGDW